MKDMKMRCSIEPRDGIYVKGYGFFFIFFFLFFFFVVAKNKVEVINMVKNFLIVLRNLQQMQ